MASLRRTETYDGTTLATLSGGALGGLVGSETLTLSTTGQFDTKDAGTGKTVTAEVTLADGGNGGLASNYTVPASSVITSADITPKSITVSGVTAANKVYDGNTTASLVGGSFSGLVGTETLTLAATGQFDTKDAGTEKVVTGVATLADGSNGGLASNYRTQRQRRHQHDRRHHAQDPDGQRRHGGEQDLRRPDAGHDHRRRARWPGRRRDPDAQQHRPVRHQGRGHRQGRHRQWRAGRRQQRRPGRQLRTQRQRRHQHDRRHHAQGTDRQWRHCGEQDLRRHDARHAQRRRARRPGRVGDPDAQHHRPVRHQGRGHRQDRDRRGNAGRRRQRRPGQQLHRACQQRHHQRRHHAARASRSAASLRRTRSTTATRRPRWSAAASAAWSARRP